MYDAILANGGVSSPGVLVCLYFVVLLIVGNCIFSDRFFRHLFISYTRGDGDVILSKFVTAAMLEAYTPLLQCNVVNLRNTLAKMLFVSLGLSATNNAWHKMFQITAI